MRSNGPNSDPLDTQLNRGSNQRAARAGAGSGFSRMIADIFSFLCRDYTSRQITIYSMYILRSNGPNGDRLDTQLNILNINSEAPTGRQREQELGPVSLV
jgi:hypothetical protein